MTLSSFCPHDSILHQAKRADLSGSVQGSLAVCTVFPYLRPGLQHASSSLAPACPPHPGRLDATAEWLCSVDAFIPHRTPGSQEIHFADLLIFRLD